jgi:hypothetical protein
MESYSSGAMAVDNTRESKSTTSTEAGCEKRPNLSDSEEQIWEMKFMLGMWGSALIVFMARFLPTPLERTQQPFYKRFIWAAIMV